MRQPNEFEYVVEGAGKFPRDMLLRDQSVPVADADAAVVRASGAYSDLLPFDRDRHRRNRVRLRCSGAFSPDTARWESLGWRVVEVPDGMEAFLSRPAGGRPRVHPEGTTPSARARASLDAFVAAGGRRKIFRLSQGAVRGLASLVCARNAASETEVVEGLIVDDIRRRGLG